MYNNAIYSSGYNPYMPQIKRKNQSVNKEGEENTSDKQKQVQQNKQQLAPINPNLYKQNQNSGDTFTKSSVQTPASINIKQVLIDFNSTLTAIGASEEVEQEVKTYLELVEKQTQKDEPNKKIITTNLKIAADVLDTYISNTLNKPSAVVKNWIDALLLQNIDFKVDTSITKGAFEAITGELPQTAKLAEKRLAKKAEEEALKHESEETIAQEEQKVAVEQETVVSSVFVAEPSSEILELTSQADALLDEYPQKALDIYSKAFEIAQNANDKSAMAEIYSKIANAQNNSNNLSQALDCLNASCILAADLKNNTLRTQNHKQMAQIYDDAGYFEPAINHYFAAIGLDGELEDTEQQAQSLNSIGKIYSAKYESENAIDYYKDALNMAKVTKNTAIMSDVFQNTALTFKNSGDKEKALSNYKNAAVLSSKTKDKESLATIYEQSADLMLEMNHSLKAGDLYKKSYRLAESLGNTEQLDRLKEKLMNIA